MRVKMNMDCESMRRPGGRGSGLDPLLMQIYIPIREYIPTIHSARYHPDVVRAPQKNKYIYTEKRNK
jgi:hypothetical protein